MEEKALAELIHPVGFYNTKAKNIKKTAALLLQNFEGEVPVSEAELVALPGALAAPLCNPKPLCTRGMTRGAFYRCWP